MTQELENMAVELSQQVAGVIKSKGSLEGIEMLLQEEFLQFQSVIKSEISIVIDDAINLIITHTTDGTIKSHDDLKKELYQLSDKIS